MSINEALAASVVCGSHENRGGQVFMGSPHGLEPGTFQYVTTTCGRTSAQARERPSHALTIEDASRQRTKEIAALDQGFFGVNVYRPTPSKHPSSVSRMPGVKLPMRSSWLPERSHSPFITGSVDKFTQLMMSASAAATSSDGATHAARPRRRHRAARALAASGSRDQRVIHTVDPQERKQVNQIFMAMQGEAWLESKSWEVDLWQTFSRCGKDVQWSRAAQPRKQT